MKLTKEELAWVFYDCGNSAYSMAVTTALLPIVFGMFGNISNQMDLGFFNSIASLVVALLSPILGTIADYKDYKKRMFLFFFLLGVISTFMLAFVHPSSGQWKVLILFYILSTVGFAGANIFYDAFLVDVTTDQRMDQISTRGFAYGYIASVIPFGISLGFIYHLGLDQVIGYQIGFIITALWWGLFTVPMLRHVQQTHYIPPEKKPVFNSFVRLFHTIKRIRSYRLVVIFLMAYFFYIDGVNTIIKMVVPYASDILGENVLSTFTLLAILLVIQLIAFPCAILYGQLAKKYSAKTMIVVAIGTYIIVCVAGFFMKEVWHVFLLGAAIGTAQGGIQALSRSYYAKIIPKDQSNEFFGFYNIFGKFSSIIGPGLMAFTARITGVTRYSIFAVIPLFIIGFIIFQGLPVIKPSVGNH